MNPPSSRIPKRRASQRPLPDPGQNPSVSRRRSARVQARQRDISVPHTLGSCYESQRPLEQQQTDSQTIHIIATSPTSVPPPNPIEPSVLSPSKLQSQEHSYLPQTRNDQTRKQNQKFDKFIKTGVQGPLMRAPLTEKNLKAFEKMREQEKKPVERTEVKPNEQSPSTITTTNKDFGLYLERNNVISDLSDTKVAFDSKDIVELLNRRRSESPDQLDYTNYKLNASGYLNEASVQLSAYPLLFKQRQLEAGKAQYKQHANYSWSEVDSSLTTGLSNAKPNIFESYCKSDYPYDAIDDLLYALAPTPNDIAMPALAVEIKGSTITMVVAEMQCAYDGALMTDGAYIMHAYMEKPDADFYGRTQALTIGYNGSTLRIYGHCILEVPAPPDYAVCEVSGNEVVGREASNKTTTDMKYHQYLLSSHSPCDSYEDFKIAYRHARNAQDIGFKLATTRKNELWAFTRAKKAQAFSRVPVSLQQQQHTHIAPISGTADGQNRNMNDDKMDATD